MKTSARSLTALFSPLLLGLVFVIQDAHSFGAEPKPAAATHPQWTEVAPGIWKTTIGQKEDLTLLMAAGATPNREALGRLPDASFPFKPDEVEGRHWEEKVSARLPLAGDEDIYGLGVDFKNMRRTGSTFQLHVDHWGGTPGRTHAPVPLYVSTRGYAVLFDSARYINMSVGLGVRLAAANKPPVIDRTTDKSWAAQPRSDSIEALVHGKGLDIYVFAGPSPIEAIQRYNLFCGGGALPPKWGLGFMVRTPTRYSAEDALKEIEEFRHHDLPLDMLGLEPGWQSQSYPCSLEWDATRFPNPAAFLSEIEKQQVHVNLWFNPYISPTAPLYQKLLPYAGSHLVWNGIVPDLTSPDARKILAQHLEQKVVALNPRAVGGFKIDEVDGYDRYLWPDTAQFPSGHDGEELRQTFAVLAQRSVFEMFRQTNRRTLGQVRGSNAGAALFPFVIYNDNYAFDEYITAVANSGFVGVLWSPEVRGGKAEDMLRRTQAVCFSPLALYNGWATNDKLWTHTEVKDAIRSVMVLRERLLPYLYNAYAEYHYEGLPLIRPMPLIAGFRTDAGKAPAGHLDATTNPYAISKVTEIKDEYLLGADLLVAPIAPGETTRSVALPPGRWYDFYSGKLVGENESIKVTPPLEQIPLFVRDGGMIPMIEGRTRAPQGEELLALEIRHYGEKAARVRLYDDDGETFAYEKGEYSWTTLEARKDDAGQWNTSITPDKNGRTWHYREVKWTFMTSRER